MKGLTRHKIIYIISRIAFFLFLADIFFLNTGMTRHLLKYDIKNGFVDNERWPVLAISLIVLFLLEALLNYLIVTNKVRLKYVISIIKPKERTYCIYLTNLLRIVNPLVLSISVIGILLYSVICSHPSNTYEWKNEKLIGHSFGEIEGETYTGSLEAFEKKYSEGLRTFEVDFARTSDGYIVLRHDWEVPLQDFGEDNYVASRDEFVNTKILGRFTPLTLEDLFMLMKEHEDMWIVTDSKNQDPKTARQDFEDIVAVARSIDCEECLDRVVVQFYNEEMYEAIRPVYDFKGYIFTLYMRWDESFEQYREIARWCAKNDIHAITMWADWSKNIDVITYAKMFDIDIYVHTVNDVEEARNRMYDGVVGVYTDVITKDELK